MFPIFLYTQVLSKKKKIKRVTEQGQIVQGMNGISVKNRLSKIILKINMKRINTFFINYSKIFGNSL